MVNSMNTGQPFFFDGLIFDSDDPYASDKDAPEQPEFTASQMDEEKAKAYQEGKNAGLHEAERSLTQSILTVLQNIDRGMSTLQTAETIRAKQYQTECLHLTTSIMAKLFPVFNAQYGYAELEQALLEQLETHQSVEPLSIEVHNSLLDQMQQFLDQNNLANKVTLRPDPALDVYAFRMSWPDGGLIVNRDRIVQEILDMMKETLAEYGVSVHDDKALSVNTDLSADNPPSDDNDPQGEPDQ